MQLEGVNINTLMVFHTRTGEIMLGKIENIQKGQFNDPSFIEISYPLVVMNGPKGVGLIPYGIPFCDAANFKSVWFPADHMVTALTAAPGHKSAYEKSVTDFKAQMAGIVSANSINVPGMMGGPGRA